MIALFVYALLLILLLWGWKAALTTYLVVIGGIYLLYGLRIVFDRLRL